MCVLFARNHKTALESPHHLSANNWLHIIELLELRELIIIIWHTVQPLHHILLPNDLWKFCSLYNQHHTIWSQATPHHQRHDMHVPKCTYSSENTEPVLPVVACEWTSTHTPQIQTSKEYYRCLFTLATDILVACASKSWSSSIGGTAAFSNWLNKIVCILTLQHSNQMVAKFFNSNASTVGTCLFTLAYKPIHTFIHSFTQTLHHPSKWNTVLFSVWCVHAYFLFMAISTFA